MMELVDRIYPEFHTHPQATGRWSTVRPPLPQLPSDLRNIIMPRPGYVCIGHDWDQIELRLQAGIAVDKPLLDAFAAEWDVHTLNYCDVFQQPYPIMRGNPHLSVEDQGWRESRGWKGKEDDRRVFCKRFVYRLIYRGDPKHAGDIPGAKTLGLGSRQLVTASQNWLIPHYAIRAYWQRTDEFVKSHGYSYTWTGRKRRSVSVGPRNGLTPSIFRELSNFPMQGGVADIMNLSVIEVSTNLPFLEMWYTSHDATWFECPIHLEAEAWPEYKRIVQQPRNIEGTLIAFPASFKRITPDGIEEKVK